MFTSFELDFVCRIKLYSAGSRNNIASELFYKHNIFFLLVLHNMSYILSINFGRECRVATYPIRSQIKQLGSCFEIGLAPLIHFTHSLIRVAIMFIKCDPLTLDQNLYLDFWNCISCQESLILSVSVRMLEVGNLEKHNPLDLHPIFRHLLSYYECLRSLFN